MCLYERLKKKYKGLKFLNRIKICGRDVYGEKFTIHTTIKSAGHYNTINANYWQRIQYDDPNNKDNYKEKWVLVYTK